SGRSVFWFERLPSSGRATFLRTCGGALTRLIHHGSGDGRTLLAELGALGRLMAPSASLNEQMIAFYTRLFPCGMAIRVGRRPPRAFLAISPVVRQAIWRDAVRRNAGRTGRGVPEWFVSVHAPKGSIEILFVAPTPLVPEARTAWRVYTNPFGWRLEDRPRIGDTPRRDGA
ncbi:MAG TPA: hypothetical protein VM580_17020, partial [Labilithrix sp.]|nr:hypothetical protein [Labilithrix sp.]